MHPKELDPQLQRLKERFQRAAKAKDRSALEEILHPDYSFISPEGEVFNKDKLIDNILHPQTNFLNNNFKRVEREIVVSEDGNTVTEVADVELIGDLKGENKTGFWINTATYVNGDAGWLIFGNSITRNAAANP